MPRPPLIGAIALGAALALLPGRLHAQTFEEEQRTHERVEAAFEAQQPGLEALFDEHGLTWPPREIFLRVIKLDRVIEVWARNDTESAFTLVTGIDICYFSGGVGPKRRQGDRQHPEGFYTIGGFNPESHYHLSLRISYPNASDEILGVHGHLGGDIFIHGGCGSTGCLAVGDDATERLYVLAVAARTSGQTEIPIHIFPVRFSDAEDMTWLHAASTDPVLWTFWDSLRPGWDYFERTHQLPTITVGSDGLYQLVEEPGEGG